MEMHLYVTLLSLQIVIVAERKEIQLGDPSLRIATPAARKKSPHQLATFPDIRLARQLDRMILLLGSAPLQKVACPLP